MCQFYNGMQRDVFSIIRWRGRGGGGGTYVDLHNLTGWQLFCQASEFARNILIVNIMYLKASTGANFLEKIGGDEAVDHEIDLKCCISNSEMFEIIRNSRNTNLLG